MGPLLNCNMPPIATEKCFPNFDLIAAMRRKVIILPLLPAKREGVTERAGYGSTQYMKSSSIDLWFRKMSCVSSIRRSCRFFSSFFFEKVSNVLAVVNLARVGSDLTSAPSSQPSLPQMFETGGNYSYEGVRWWATHVQDGDLFKLGLVLIPVSLGCHWTLCVADITNKAT